LKKSIQREITNGDDRTLAWLKYPIPGLFITVGIVALLSIEAYDQVLSKLLSKYKINQDFSFSLKSAISMGGL
jgi:hypothetical protein